MVKATFQRMRAQTPSGAGCYKVLAPSKTRESVGRRDRAPESSTPLVLCWRGPTAPLAVHCHCVLHTGLEGWAATAPGTTDLPLRWAGGEIITEWDGEEPVDFLAPGIVCAGSLGGCSAVRTPWCSRPTATLVQEAVGSIPDLSMFL